MASKSFETLKKRAWGEGLMNTPTHTHLPKGRSRFFLPSFKRFFFSIFFLPSARSIWGFIFLCAKDQCPPCHCSACPTLNFWGHDTKNSLPMNPRLTRWHLESWNLPFHICQTSCSHAGEPLENRHPANDALQKGTLHVGLPSWAYEIRWSIVETSSTFRCLC